MPSSSFDTFFACTILVAAALVSTAFLASTLGARIEATQDVNRGSFQEAIADHLIANPGVPVDWGEGTTVPSGFGLASASSAVEYQLDMDKLSRLNSQNTAALSYDDIFIAAKLNMALGITVSQLITLDITQSSNSTVGPNTSFTFTLETNIDSKPTSANLHCYLTAQGYQSSFTSQTSYEGTGAVNFQMPTSVVDDALLVVFAKATFDDRINSYGIYDFHSSNQETTPASRLLALSPLDYTLHYNVTSPDVLVQEGYAFSYSYQEDITSLYGSQVNIPQFIDKSPTILVVCGTNSGEYFQEWVAYPQIPLKAGADFEGSAQNVYSYIVTVNGGLYRLDISLGDAVY